MQIVGAFLLQMVMGSILSITSSLLDWSILNERLETPLKTSYLIITLNIAMLLRLYLNRFMNRKRRLIMQIFSLFSYSACLFLMAILPQNLMFIVPNIYVFFVGLIILDTLDQLLIDDPLQFEKYICLFFCGLFCGWVAFGITLQLLIEHIQGDLLKPCLLYATMITVCTIIGFYLFYPRYSTVDEEFDSRSNLKESQNRDLLHNTFIVQEKNILKDENFYLVMYKFAMLFTPAIGSMDYVLLKENDLLYNWLCMGVATIIGSLFTMLLKQPYKFNTVIVIAQLGMMIAINLLGVVHNLYQIPVLIIQFGLFGFVCCFNVLILQNTYDNVIDNIPIAFIALTLTTMVQHILFSYIDNRKLIQSIEFSMIVISYLSNWLII